jgi:hypothetical protein
VHPLTPNSNEIVNIYSDISDLFYNYLEEKFGDKNIETIFNRRITKIKNSTQQNVDPTKPCSTLTSLEDIFCHLHEFFKNEEYNRYIKTVIYSYTDIKNKQFNKRGRPASLEGGKNVKEKFSEEELFQLYTSVQTYIKTTEFISMQQEMVELYAQMAAIDQMPIPPENYQESINALRKEYNKTREVLISNLAVQYTERSGDKYAKTLQEIRIISEKIPKNFDVASNILNVISSSLKTPEKIAKQKIEKEESESKKIADDVRRLESGKLTTKDKTLVGKFMNLIAKMGLLLTKSITRTKNGNEWDHNVNRASSEPTTLKVEVDSLLYVADIAGGSISNKDIDTILINHYIPQEPNYNYASYLYKRGEELEQNLNCRSDKKYIINNAAAIGSLKKYAFCPYTSIIDGMSTCSWKTAKTDGIEYGNMDFKITGNDDNSLYYNGFLNIPDDNNYDGNYPTIIDVGFNVNFPGFERVEGKKRVNMKNVDVLDAAVVLRNTLLTILLSIPDLDYENVWDDIYNRLEEDVNDPLDATNTKQIKIYALIYREILFKGVGDLFQEINAVAKYGGYTTKYICDQDIYSYPQDGNQTRCFLANDRPSGTRFVYMLLNGQENEINKKAFGGYYATSGEKDVLVKRSENANICK